MCLYLGDFEDSLLMGGEGVIVGICIGIGIGSILSAIILILLQVGRKSDILMELEIAYKQNAKLREYLSSCITNHPEFVHREGFSWKYNFKTMNWEEVKDDTQ